MIATTVPLTLFAAQRLLEKVLLSSSPLLRRASTQGAIEKSTKVNGAINAKYPPPTGVHDGYQRGDRTLMWAINGNIPVIFIG